MGSRGARWSIPIAYLPHHRREAPAAFAFRDDRVAVIMDRNPLARGHALVIPLRHVELLADLDEEMGMHLFRVGMRMDRALRASEVGADAVRLSLSDGRAAGQEVPHVHLHVIPRHWGQVTCRSRVDLGALARVAEDISAAYRRLYIEG